MDHHQPGTVMAVKERQLVRKSDNQPFTIYDVETSVGTLGTTVKQLAEHARSVIGVPLVIGWTEKQNERDGRTYTNLYLETLEPLPQQEIPVPPQPGSAAEEIMNAAAALHQPTQPSYDMTAEVSRDESIWRQSAAKTAAQFNNKDLGQYWERVEMLLNFYRTGIIPVAEESQFIPSGTTAAANAADDPDIPF